MYAFYQSFERILETLPNNIYISEDDWESFLLKNFPLSYYEIGHSKEGLKLFGVKIGNGNLKASIIAGCSADEPVGPYMVKCFLTWLKQSASGSELLKKWTFFIIPQMNPDGAARNKYWTQLPLSLKLYLEKSRRDLPSEDLEFGFPISHTSNNFNVHPENKSAADFLGPHGPFHAHFSLHNLIVGGGAWFLIDQKHSKDSFQLQAKLKGIAEKSNIPLYDIDRKGEKGFVRLSAGFSTTPSSAELRKYYQEHSHPDWAENTHLSSMDFIENLGGEPLSLVSEIPMFYSLKIRSVKTPEELKLKHFFQSELMKASKDLQMGDSQLFDQIMVEWNISPISFKDQIRIQFRTILCALAEIKNNPYNRFAFFQ